MRALLDEQTRQRLGLAARQTVEPLTLAAMSNRLAQLYQALLAPP
jgi:hypothetical protein